MGSSLETVGANPSPPHERSLPLRLVAIRVDPPHRPAPLARAPLARAPLAPLRPAHCAAPPHGGTAQTCPALRHK